MPRALLLFALCVSGLHEVPSSSVTDEGRSTRALGKAEGQSCVYRGRWYRVGSEVPSSEACLRCVCAAGALACHRRACEPTPDPPRRCHIVHRKGACCPEIQCPEGVKSLELSAAARFETDDFSDIVTPSSPLQVCVEDGSVFAAGSALAARAACEQCFCLRGERRCVRPRCLPVPRGCAARPAHGACCPQRYYCQHEDNPVTPQRFDCQVGDKWVGEGERVRTREAACERCFCLRGVVHCQPLACAPPLLGCRPLLRAGECCPHQYHCEHTGPGAITTPAFLSNSLVPMKIEDRSLHTSKSAKLETTTKVTSTKATRNISSTKADTTNISTSNTPTTTATKNISTSNTPTTTATPSTTVTAPTAATAPDTTTSVEKTAVTTIKVKRKTSDAPLQNTNHKTTQKIQTTSVTTKKAPSSKTTVSIPSTKELPTTEKQGTTTEQPEGTVKIMINGTINCTAELSSTSVPMNFTANETERINMESMARVPLTDALESHTSYHNDIITDRSPYGGFDENETFTINVTSSLRTNSSGPPRPMNYAVSKVTPPVGVVEHVNVSKDAKEEYYYDYNEPTLPPSLPNLKIIPFVAADAVVDDDDTSEKNPLSYTPIEREDKFPVYYPTIVASKQTPFATRREDLYNPTQYPVFISDKVNALQYPSLTQTVDLTSATYPTASNDVSSISHDFTLSTTLGNPVSEINKAITQIPSSTTSEEGVESPLVNLFSPPLETEGGFVPKGPGIIEEYYAVYPSTPPGPPIPHLTTSMQLDVDKGECISGDGRHVPEGDTISLACSICSCAWGELHCAPRPCLTPPGCHRRPASSISGDLCCGDLICDSGNKTSSQPVTTEKPILLFNKTFAPVNITITTEATTKTTPVNYNTTKTKESFKPIISKPNTTDKIKTQSPVDNSPVDKSPAITESDTKLSTENVTVEPVTSTYTTTRKPIPTTTAPIATTTNVPVQQTTPDKNNSQEYEYEEEEDEGFSFGNVLKLLLSDTYDSTSAQPSTRSTTTTIKPTIRLTPPPPALTTRKPVSRPQLSSFIPMPLHPYGPQKKLQPQTTVNRIDHLVLGEATAIKRTSPIPITITYKPAFFKPVTVKTTHKPILSTRASEVPKVDQNSVQYNPVVLEAPRPSSPGVVGVGAGMLKLAGCNIYGRMYRVGKVIAELSTPCMECRCTELGVQCRSLNC